MTSYSNLSIAAEDRKAPRQPAGLLSPGEADAGISIGDLAEKFGLTLRALRFYQSKGLLAPGRSGRTRLFSPEDCERLALILQGRRLGFTLTEVRDMLNAWQPGSGQPLPITRKQCVEQIKLLERNRRDAEMALHELRQIYTGMFVANNAGGTPVNKA